MAQRRRSLVRAAAWPDRIAHGNVNNILELSAAPALVRLNAGSVRPEARRVYVKADYINPGGS